MYIITNQNDFQFPSIDFPLFYFYLTRRMMMILNVLTEDLSHQEATIRQYTQGMFYVQAEINCN